MRSQVGEDEMSMSEEQEVRLFVIALVFVDLCLRSRVSLAYSMSSMVTNLLQQGACCPQPISDTNDRGVLVILRVLCYLLDASWRP